VIVIPSGSTDESTPPKDSVILLDVNEKKRKFEEIKSDNNSQDLET
jgi:hypothetical protein